MIKVQFAARPERWETYQTPLETAFSQAGLQVDLRQDHPAAGELCDLCAQF
jgi:glyoxylate/hydroxypyruvate reductase A